MSERPAPYTVDNIVFFNFRSGGLRIDGGESDREEYKVESKKAVRRVELRIILDDFYVRVHSGEAKELERMIPKIILGYTQLLQDAEGYDAALIAYRLANTELLFAALHRDAPTDFSRTMAHEALIRYSQLIEFAGDSVVVFEDLGLLQLIPFKAHLNSGIALGILGAYDEAWEHLELAESKEAILLSNKRPEIRNAIRQAIADTREVVGDMT